MADIPSNFTLLVGTQSFDCSQGREIEIDAASVAAEKNAAGLLVNKNLNSTMESYSLFLPIDPLHVANYSLTLKKM